MHARPVAFVLTLVIALSVAACGAAGGQATQAAGDSVSISGAWVRAKEAGATTAAYLVVTNAGSQDDALVGVSATGVTSDASLHETTSDASGMTGMHHTPSIAVPAGGTLTLEPGGYHIMLMDLTRALAEGDRVELRLTFERAGTVAVTAEVRAN